MPVQHIHTDDAVVGTRFPIEKPPEEARARTGSYAPGRTAVRWRKCPTSKAPEGDKLRQVHVRVFQLAFFVAIARHYVLTGRDVLRVYLIRRFAIGKKGLQQP